jgi:hypothetical protein
MEALIIIGAVALYAAVLSTINFMNNKKSGKITENGVISPEGKEIVKKQSR